MELPVFKESDLTFHNAYSSLEKDTRCSMLKEVESGQMRGGTGTGAIGQGAIGGGSGGLAMQRFIQDKQSNNTLMNLTFSSFDQVMLSLSRVEDGMNQLLSVFNSQASPDIFIPSVDAQGLSTVFKLIGVKDVSYRNIETCISRSQERENDNGFLLDNHSSRVRQKSWTDRANGNDDSTGAASGRGSGMISFQNFLNDPLCVDSIAPEHDMAPSNEKIKRAFQIIRATFFLLDTDGDGEITLDELQQSKGMMGELSIGKELKNAFNRKVSE